MSTVEYIHSLVFICELDYTRFVDNWIMQYDLKVLCVNFKGLFIDGMVEIEYNINNFVFICV